MTTVTVRCTKAENYVLINTPLQFSASSYKEQKTVSPEKHFLLDELKTKNSHRYII